MAWQVVPTITKISENCFRVSGGALAINSSGTIGFTEKTVPAEVSFNAPNWDPYVIDGQTIDPVEFVKADLNIMGTDSTGAKMSIDKTGTTKETFLIRVRNDSLTSASTIFEIYLTKP